MGSLRAPLILSLLIVAGMAALSLWAWLHLPADARIAIHFGSDGKANGFASRDVALSIAPLTAAALTALFALLPVVSRKPGNRSLAGSPLWLAGWLGALMVLAVTHAIVVMLARGVLVEFAGNMNFLMALLWIVIGNFLGKSSPNDYAGVRTSWTKASDYSWQKSNRIAGWMTVGIGLAMLGAMAAGVDQRWVRTGMIAALLVMAVILFPLSRYYWARDPDRENPDQA